MSRTNDRRFLFEKGRVKTQLVDALKRAAAFSGVELEAYVAMDNHFHIVCKVVRREDELPEGELLRRIFGYHDCVFVGGNASRGGKDRNL